VGTFDFLADKPATTAEEIDLVIFQGGDFTVTQASRIA